jgi:hypothetical protein
MSPRITHAYHLEKKRMQKLGSLRRALENAQRWQAEWVSFPSAASYTFTAYRRTAVGLERCHYTDDGEGRFSSTGQWRKVPALPATADCLRTLLAEEAQIAAWRHKDESALLALYREPKALTLAMVYHSRHVPHGRITAWNWKTEGSRNLLSVTSSDASRE